MKINKDALKSRKKIYKLHNINEINKDNIDLNNIDVNNEFDKFVERYEKEFNDYMLNWIYQYIITRYTSEEFFHIFDDYQTFSDFMNELTVRYSEEYNKHLGW